jgi:hypothetical protein
LLSVADNERYRWKGEQMSVTLKAYMVQLAINIDQLSDFVDDPQKASEKAGLSSHDRAVLLSGDQSLIYATLTATSSSGSDGGRKVGKKAQ